MNKLKGFLATNVGNVRDINQDNGFVGQHVFVVADGMGGHRGGEVASEVAVEAFGSAGEVLTAERLVELATKANSLIFDKSKEDGLQGMGTTLVALAVHEDGTVSAVNVGDSRIYWLRGGYLAQVTKDHSFVSDLVEQEEISPEEALVHPQRNVITRALGIAPEVEVDRFPLSVKTGDRFLLCSDGLTDEVNDDDITKILVEESELSEAADALVREALNNGGRDNVTALVVDVLGEITEETDGVAESESSEDSITEQDVAESESEIASVDEEPEVQTSRLASESSDAGEEDQVAESESQTDILPKEDFPTGESKKGRRLAASLVLIGCLLAGYFLLRTYSRSSWYLEEKDGTVAIYNGQPDGFLWFNGELKEESDIKVADLTDDSAKKFLTADPFSEFSEADSFVKSLEQRSSTTRKEIGRTLTGE